MDVLAELGVLSIDLTEESSGFAIRRPPKDCDRLKSPSMARWRLAR